MNTDPKLSRRLSGIDAAFLYLERREIPLAIAGVFIFDGPIGFDDFVANLTSKLHLIPRYRQVAVPPPFNLGYPTWEDYPRFDILEHVYQETLPSPAGDAELEDLAGRLFSQVMDRNKPLWQVYIVNEMSGGRGALIVRVHHALADGISGAALLKVMFDATPEGMQAIPKPPVRRISPPPKEPSIVEAVGSAIHSSLKSMVAAEAALLDFGQHLLSDDMQNGLQGLLKLLPEWAKPLERLPFNRPCGGERKFCWTEIDFADIKAIRERLGGTVNEVILSVVTQAVSRYAKFHGQAVDDRFVRMVCPVNVREPDQDGSWGNQITFLPVMLPMDIANPVEMLRAVSARMEVMKSVRLAELMGILGSWIGAMPVPMQALFWEGLPLVPMPLPLFNMICTNIPGSTTPLYSLGRRMIGSYPQVPTGYELGVGVAVQSYDGKMFFGLNADAQAAADVTRLRDYIADAFRNLRRSAGVRKPSTRARKDQRPIPESLAASAD